MAQGVYVIKKHLTDARRAIRRCRVELEGAEPWLDGEDMVVVQRIWDRALLERRIEHLGQLEDTFAGLLAICEEVA